MKCQEDVTQVNAIDLMLEASGSPEYAIGRARLRFPSLIGISSFRSSDDAERGDAGLTITVPASNASSENKNLSAALISAERLAAEELGGDQRPIGSGPGVFDDAKAARIDNFGNGESKTSQSSSLAGRMRAIFASEDSANNREAPAARSKTGGFSPQDFLASVEKSGLSSCFASHAAHAAESSYGSGVGAFDEKSLGRTEHAQNSANASLLECVPSGTAPCVLMFGKMPFWSSDIELALGGVKLVSASSIPDGMHAVAALVLGNVDAPPACELPIIKAAGKKSLWKALIAHGLVRRPKR